LPVYAVAEQTGRDTKYKPEARKGKAYLSAQIKRHIRVIPYIPVHNEIIEYPYRKFYCGYQQRTNKTAAYQRHGSAAVDDIQQCQYKSSR
jgi:hypothetical protein